MKRIIFMAIVLSIGGIGTVYFNGMPNIGGMEYAQEIKEVIVTETVTEKVSEVDQRIKTAQDAARAEVEAEGDRRKKEYVENRMLEIEAQVRDQFIAEQEEVNKQIKSKINAY